MQKYEQKRREREGRGRREARGGEERRMAVRREREEWKQAGHGAVQCSGLARSVAGEDGGRKV